MEIATKAQCSIYEELFDESTNRASHPSYDFLRPFFHIIANVNFDQVRFFYLGEIHFADTDLYRVLLHHIAKPGDILRLEGIPHDLRIPAQILRLYKPHMEKYPMYMNYTGWEDQQAWYRALELHNKQLSNPRINRDTKIIIIDRNKKLIELDDEAHLENQKRQKEGQSSGPAIYTQLGIGHIAAATRITPRNVSQLTCHLGFFASLRPMDPWRPLRDSLALKPHAILYPTNDYEYPEIEFDLHMRRRRLLR